MSVPHHRSGSVNTPSSFTSRTSSKYDVVPTNSRYAATAAMMRNAYMDPSSMNMPRTASDLDFYGSAKTAGRMCGGGGYDDDYDDNDSRMFSGAARTAASMYDMHEARTAASMYDMREARTAASMYDMREARTASSMYDDAVMRAARTATSMYDEPEIRAFSNPYSRSSIPTTSKSFMPSMACPVTKSSFPQPLFPNATTASAFGEYWE